MLSIAVLVSRQGGRQQGVQITRNAQGQVGTVETTWGYRQANAYDPQGRLQKVELRQENDQAVIDFSQGKVNSLQQFDGGRWTLAYYQQGDQAGRVKTIHMPNGLDLSYAYNTAGQPVSVVVGDT